MQQKRNFLQPHPCLAWCLGLIRTFLIVGQQCNSIHGQSFQVPDSRVALVAFVLKLNHVFF